MNIAEEDRKLEHLAQQIVPLGRLLRTWPLQGGISAQMTALEIEDPGGQTRKLILRRPGVGALERNPQAARDEFTLLQILHSLGLATPAPLVFDPSGQIFPTPYLLIEFVRGRLEFAPGNLADYTHQMAGHLARIHRVDGARLDLAFLPRLAEEVASRLDQRSTRVNPVFVAEPIHDALVSAWPFGGRNAPVLLHGDYWPGNLLWRDEQLVAVIDWEDARLGDPLSDLAISRLDLLWIFGIDAMNSFTRDYLAETAIDPHDLPFWDLYAALRLVRMAGADLAGWAAFFPPFGRDDITAQTIRKYYQDFIRQAFEKLA